MVDFAEKSRLGGTPGNPITLFFEMTGAFAGGFFAVDFLWADFEAGWAGFLSITSTGGAGGGDTAGTTGAGGMAGRAGLTESAGDR